MYAKHSMLSSIMTTIKQADHLLNEVYRTIKLARNPSYHLNHNHCAMEANSLTMIYTE